MRFLQLSQNLADGGAKAMPASTCGPRRGCGRGIS